MLQAAPEARNVAAVFDLDGTITRCDTYVRFLSTALRQRPRRLICAHGLASAVAAHKLGRRDNSWLKSRFLSLILGGCTRSELDEIVEAFLPRVYRRDLKPGAMTAIDRHRDRGDRLVLATASFDFYTFRIGERLGFDDVVCTKAAWKGDRLSGEILGGNCDGTRKRDLVARAFPDRSAWRVVAYSDHHSDLPLLEWSDRGVVVDPSRSLRRLAMGRGLEIASWRHLAMKGGAS